MKVYRPEPNVIKKEITFYFFLLYVLLFLFSSRICRVLKKLHLPCSYELLQTSIFTFMCKYEVLVYLEQIIKAIGHLRVLVKLLCKVMNYNFICNVPDKGCTAISLVNIFILHFILTEGWHRIIICTIYMSNILNIELL
ncbi:hypothetical protein V1478_003763 [Vespula squamosa]|uniref:Uncharacterized protein n=1 Tax=Vespula squamosa TaxID=30214 RepID=A0ABD2BNB0_VESSQ